MGWLARPREDRICFSERLLWGLGLAPLRDTSWVPPIPWLILLILRRGVVFTVG